MGKSLMTIDQQCADVKSRIAAADKERERSEHHAKKADDMLLSAAIQLQKVREAVGDNRGKRGVVTWVQCCEKIGISRRRADELLQVVQGDTTFDEQRGRAREGMRQSRGEEKNGRNSYAHSSEPSKKTVKARASACDYDWSKPDPKDFGDPSEMYGKQADHYYHEAIHLAESLPILSDGVDVKVIRAKLPGAQAVADAWLRAVSQLKSRVK